MPTLRPRSRGGIHAVTVMDAPAVFGIFLRLKERVPRLLLTPCVELRLTVCDTTDHGVGRWSDLIEMACAAASSLQGHSWEKRLISTCVRHYIPDFVGRTTRPCPTQAARHPRNTLN